MRNSSTLLVPGTLNRKYSFHSR
uniref:Uncharacterized protein n=1 Tax=Anopheles christyi TaxID=43041 RepID=A0A182KIA4_9DIPT